ncbi:MAG: dehydrogenase [Betaproteobacteria bacterium TMED156]|nr:MAG: dehydrogenase [Betaproteobacteria bacterium TMED156]
MTILSEPRRNFLKKSSIGTSVLFIGLNSNGLLAATSSISKDVIFNPFVKIDKNGIVTVVSKHFEMGQGTTTGLTTLVAEELDANWLTTKVEFAPADATKYKNLLFGVQGTGGSTAMPNSFFQYREAGAAAREVLVKAAANKWGVSESSVKVSDGYLSANGNRAHFGEFIDEASSIQPSENPKLKDSNDFKLIGNPNLNRKDNFDKTTGRAIYSSDVKVPGMVYVAIIRSPKFGGSLKSFDASGAKDSPGFIDAKALPNKAGVAVFGKNTWALSQARNKITTSWDFSKAETRSSHEIVAAHKELINKEPAYQAKKGYTTEQANEKLKTAEKFVEVEFLVPFLAHSPMEPVNCVIEPTRNGILIHDGCQIPTLVQGTLASILKIKPEQIQIKTYFAGGSFGRRVTPNCDYHVEAALAFDLLGRKTPVKLVWSREDDVKGGWYRPMAAQKAIVGLDKDGNIIAWNHRTAVKSIAKGGPFESSFVKDGVDHWSVESISDSIYDIPNIAVGHSDFLSPIPVLWWRAVGHTQNVLAMESLIDMAAHKGGKDPVELRLSLLKNGTSKQLRFANVIKIARDMSRWQSGQKRGFASSFTFGTFLAVVADVTADGDQIHVDKLYVAIDCGVAINPDIIRAQLEGGMGYGLSAIAHSEITFKDGEVEQDNFPNYPTLRMSQMPEVEVKIVDSSEKPGGLGEPGTPIVGPAVANAIFAVTGKRVTEFPLSKSGLELV